MITTGPVQGPGGVENVARNLAEQLKSAGIDVANVHAYENYNNPVTSAIKFREVAKKVGKINPDIIHTHDNSAYWIAKSENKFIHTSHGTWKNYFDYMPKNLRDMVISRFIISMEKTTVSKAAINTAVSNFVKNSVSSQYGIRRKIHVIHNGVDTRKFKPEQANKRRDITALWVGTNPALKGLDITIKAAEIAGINLIVVGTEGKSTKYTKYLGRVRPEDMNNIYNRADLLLFPSFYESYPIVPLEAMASGLPVVVSEASHVEIMKNGREGYIVKSHKPKDYAKAIEKVIDTRKKLGKAARRTAKRYDWSKQAKHYISLYEKFF
jgi:glycosyltransferase involved in cell wall biosynthesis